MSCGQMKLEHLGAFQISTCRVIFLQVFFIHELVRASFSWQPYSLCILQERLFQLTKQKLHWLLECTFTITYTSFCWLHVSQKPTQVQENRAYSHLSMRTLSRSYCEKAHVMGNNCCEHLWNVQAATLVLHCENISVVLAQHIRYTEFETSYGRAFKEIKSVCLLLSQSKYNYVILKNLLKAQLLDFPWQEIVQ